MHTFIIIFFVANKFSVVALLAVFDPSVFSSMLFVFRDGYFARLLTL